MKHSLVFVFLLASGVALSAPAQTPSAPAAPAGAPKIAVISFQAAVGQTNQGQRDFSDLQKKFEPKRQQLKALSDEIDTLTKQLQTQGDSLSDAARASRAKTIDDKKKQLDRSSEDARNDYQGEMQDLYGSLASKVYDVLASYAQQHGYTLVLDISQQQNQAPVVLFASPTTDITKAVIDAYNLKSGVPAPAAQPTAPPGQQAAPPAKPSAAPSR